MDTSKVTIDSDFKEKVDSLAERVSVLENEKQQIRDEFNIQRAKMKDLYLQKEDEVRRLTAENTNLSIEIQKLSSELGEAKSQLLATGFQMETDLKEQETKARQEIATLEQLVHETVEESSSSRTMLDSEISQLKMLVQKLQTENQEIKSNQSHESSILGPNVISAMTKTLVRKLGADNTDSMDDAMRKVNRYAQEDAEVLRSLVVPLEEEIKALKDKLRAADQQLQEYEQARSKSFLQHPENHNSEDMEITMDQEKSVLECDMCANYETQLVRSQKTIASLENKILLSEKNTELAKEEIQREIQLRNDMQMKWEQQKDQHKAQVMELSSRTETSERELAELKNTFSQTYTHVMEQLSSLTQHREQVYLHLQRLQKDNDNLVGKYSAHSQQLQSEMINLPDKVEELQELLLKSHEELIEAKVSAEFCAEQEQTVKCEISLLRDQMAMEQQQRETLENNLAQEINMLKKQIHMLEKERKGLLLTKDKLAQLETSYAQSTEHLNSNIESLTNRKKEQDAAINDLRQRVASLQQELYVSETVQKDFVRLSQSLQVNLEKIRAGDTEVRWQHEEDIEECPTCRQDFNVAKRKQHCRHCGRIFCTNCLTHIVPSGPASRPSRVCDVCHTLLVRDTAPYFSTEPPHSPD